jgi:HK97 family phage major capsid protein
MQHKSALRGGTALPVALLRTPAPMVRADNRDPNALFNQLTTAVSGLRSNVDAALSQDREQIANLAAAMDALQQQIGGGIGPIGGAISPPEPDYTRAFAAYTRTGGSLDLLQEANASGERAQVHAAMSVGSGSDGGVLAPVEWDRRLHERQRATSPMRRLATVQVTGIGAFTTLWNNDQWGSGWVGETAARPQTSTASLVPIPFAAGEIYANAAATQRLLDDAAINVDNWLINSLEREFNRQENIAFLSGDGVNKPHGVLTYIEGGVNEATHPGGALTVVEGAIGYDALVDFIYGLDAPYRQNATWLMSSLTASMIAKLKDADGQPLWRQSMIVGQPDTLLGRPVEIDEGMPPPAAGNICIAFGDFRAGYLINDRLGTRVLRDPYTNKPFVMFYATKRVGAGLLDPHAIRLLRLSE